MKRLPVVRMAGITLVALLGGCGNLDDGRETRIKIAMPALSQQSRLARPAGSVERFSAPPTTLSGFDCVAVNVMGANISESGSSPNRKPMNSLLGGQKCSYAGIVSKLVASSAGGDIELVVPRGPNRLIQVLGIVSPGGCNVSTLLPTRFDRRPSMTSDPIFPGVYEIGRAVVDLTGPQTVEVSSNYSYDAANPPTDVRCAIANVDCSDAANNRGATSTGAGTISDPYHICTATQLQGVGVNFGSASSHYALETNIDLAGNNFSALFPSGFTGSFSGQGYTVSRLTIPTGVSAPVALISKMANGSSIDGVNLSAVDITSSSAGAGGLVGHMLAGTISNSHTSGTITITSNNSGTGVGGLVGRMQAGTVSQSSSSVDISVNADVQYIGGLIGVATSGTTSLSISECHATGNISAGVSGFVGGTYVGGLVGVTSAGSSTTTISRSYATGAVSGLDIVGGFVGNVVSTTISNSYSSGSVQATAAANAIAGGFVGVETSSSISNCFTSTTSVVSGNHLGAIAANGTLANFTNCFSNVAITPSNVGGELAGTQLTTANFNKQSSFPGFDFTTIWKIDEGVSPPTLR